MNAEAPKFVSGSSDIQKKYNFTQAFLKFVGYCAPAIAVIVLTRNILIPKFISNTDNLNIENLIQTQAITGRNTVLDNTGGQR